MVKNIKQTFQGLQFLSNIPNILETVRKVSRNVQAAVNTVEYGIQQFQEANAKEVQPSEQTDKKE
ncbi:MAG TPA: hypothetical protein VGD89_14490 [Flavipsychrobacter sp.]